MALIFRKLLFEYRGGTRCNDVGWEATIGMMRRLTRGIRGVDETVSTKDSRMLHLGSSEANL